ncbi:MAG: hypothetical protein ACKOXB_15010 [Flavobacteriales bacterium]
MKKQRKKYNFTSIDQPPKGVHLKGGGSKIQLTCSTFNFSLVFVWIVIFAISVFAAYYLFTIFIFLSLAALYFMLVNALGQLVVVIHEDLLIVNEKSLFSNSGFDIRLSSVASVKIHNRIETIKVGKLSRPQSYLHEEIRIQSVKGYNYAFGNGMNSEGLWFLLFVIEEKMKKQNLRCA